MFRTTLSLLAVIALTAALNSATAAPLGPKGPDGFGYTGDDIEHNLRNIRTSGTFVPLADDNQSPSIPLGFTFNFYGQDFTSVHISSNGFLDFDGGANGCCTGLPLPQVDGVSGGIIAGFWEDLDPGNGGAPNENVVAHQTLGTPGNREFVVGFYDVDHFSNGDNVTFEMILHEGSNNIEFQYRNADSDGGTHSIGIESPDQLDGLQMLLENNGGPLPLIRQGYLITAIPEPSAFLLVALAATGSLAATRRRVFGQRLC